MKIHGFSVIELLGTLIILSGILLITNHFVTEINQRKELNAVSDQMIYFNNVAIKFIADNYRNLEESTQVNDLIIPYSVMSMYTSIGNNPIPATKIKPCLYLSNGSNNILNAYLYFGNATNVNQVYSYLVATKVAQNIGGNVGVLMQNDNGFNIQGNLFSNFAISNSDASLIANGCGFIGGNLIPNSIVIAVSQDKRLFASIQTDVDRQSKEVNQDPSLKRSGSGDDVTMQTNLYLDNVIQESSTKQQYYCDVSKLPIKDSDIMCIQFGANHHPIYTMDAGSASWISSILDSPTTCKASSQAKFTDPSTGNELGYISCGSIEYNALESDTNTPTQHVYQALDFGKSPFGTNQRIQMKSDASIGAPLDTSQLDINNAGIEAGYIAPISHPITPGSICSPTDLGKMAQEFNPVGAGGQLQCSYNPTFCSGNGYCYLPTKPSGVLIVFDSLVQDGNCPSGTIVDQNQPSDGINSQVSCPAISGFAFQGIHGIPSGAYQSVTGFTFYSNYATFCVYNDGSGNIESNPIKALAKLLCSSNVTTYLVDHYRPN